MLTAALPAALGAESGNLYVTGYTLTNSSGSGISTVNKGDTVNITVSIKDTSGAGTDVGTLDITKLEDSFNGGSVSVERTSEDGKPLIYAVKLTGLQYKGVGQSLRLQVGLPNQPDTYQTLEVTITETVVYDSSSKPVDFPAPDPAPAPIVVISRSEIEKPIEPGQELTLTLSFRNLSNISLKSPVGRPDPYRWSHHLRRFRLLYHG